MGQKSCRNAPYRLSKPQNMNPVLICLSELIAWEA